MRQVIEEFLDNAKKSKFKSRIKSKTEKFEKEFKRKPELIDIEKFNQEINDEFSFENWILNKSKTAYQVQLTTHPSRFSHPNALASGINFAGLKQSDGYLTSNNHNYEFDLVGTAEQIPLMDFLNLIYQEKKILNHLKIETEESKEVFDTKNIGYKNIFKGFLSVINDSKTQSTNTLVKQVYFYIGDKKYHNLSILTNSFIASELNNKVREIKFSDQTKELKKLRKNNQFSLQKIEDLLNLFKISYGGSNAQNISSINAKNAGKFYLLSSLPPIIEKREIRLPKTDFFHQSLNKYHFKFHFEQLEKFIQDKRNNKPIRDSITNIVGDITDDVIEIIYKIRDLDSGWSEQENYKNLPKNQKILLDNHYLETRASSQESIDDFIEDLARWILACYQKFYPKTAKDFGDDELMGFERRINLSSDIKKSLNQIKGVL